MGAFDKGEMLSERTWDSKHQADGKMKHGTPRLPPQTQKHLPPQALLPGPQRRAPAEHAIGTDFPLLSALK